MRRVSTILALFVALATAPTFASIQASSKLAITDFIIQKTDGTPLVLGTDISIVLAASSSYAEAVMNGLADGSQIASGGLDKFAFSNGVATGDLHGANNTGTTAGIPDPFALSDTFGGGDILDNTAGGGADVTVFSAVGVDSGPPIVDAGSATAAGSLLVFSISNLTGTEIEFEINFDAALDIIFANSVPPGTLTGDAAFRVALDGVSTDGGVTVGSFEMEPIELNPDLLTNPNSPGVAFSDSFTSGALILPAGGSTDLSIRQGTSASAGPYVPEPTAAIVWGVLLAFGATRTARRS